MKSMLEFATTLVTVAVLMLTAQPVLSDTVKVEFTATVYEVQDEYELLGGAPIVGDVITGHYWYDTEAEDTMTGPDEDWIGLYWPSPAGILVNFADHELSSGLDGEVPTDVRVINDHPLTARDIFIVEISSIENQKPLWNGEQCYNGTVQFYLNKTDGSLFSDDSLPAYVPDLDLFGEYDYTHVTLNCSVEYSKWFYVHAELVSATQVFETPLEQLMNAVSLLAETGYISEKQANSLVKKLFLAEVRFNGDLGGIKSAGGCSQMQAFIHQLRAFTPRFIPQEPESEELENLALSIMEEQGCF